MDPFLIIGQPRSGTTYLQTLINAHPDAHCRGELFDPWQIDDDGEKTQGLDAVIARDADPAGFLDARLKAPRGLLRRGARCIGAKVLFQHHPALFARYIPDRPGLRLIHVRRENKLAQFASMQQVAKTGQWTAPAGGGAAPKIDAAPFWAASECNRMENEDFLLDAWLATLPNPVLRVTYRGLFARDFETRLQDFLGLKVSGPLTSSLKKQGQNTILDRFASPGPIERYFRETGRADWLGPELAAS
ncbi:sulfotransferase [Pararhodobacter marinus]|uniref:sulfotransferase n=3 Tax=Pararhodobacter marinus TaxID=2184063 RepID=UPI003515F544